MELLFWSNNPKVAAKQSMHKVLFSTVLHGSLMSLAQHAQIQRILFKSEIFSMK
jgi:hypothetical protein